ncbi:hypothetical protein Tco_0528400 [Tanacetum coccineum]
MWSKKKNMIFKFRGNKQSSHIIVVEDEVVLEEEDVADQAIFNAIVAKRQLMDCGFDVFFNSKNKTCTVIKDGEVMVKSSMTEQNVSRRLSLRLQLLVNKEMVKGLPIIKEREHTCEGCPLGKQARNSFLVAQAKRAEEKLELVHADICAFGFFKKFEALAEEFKAKKGKEFSGFSNEHGIKRELTAPYTPEQSSRWQDVRSKLRT